MNLSEWNIKDLIDLQIQVTAEITARLRSVEMLDNNFHTYAPNGSAEEYKTLIETSVDLLRKGQSRASHE